MAPRLGERSLGWTRDGSGFEGLSYGDGKTAVYSTRACLGPDCPRLRTIDKANGNGAV
jgi:hypothetical protein